MTDQISHFWLSKFQDWANKSKQNTSRMRRMNNWFLLIFSGQASEPSYDRILIYWQRPDKVQKANLIFYYFINFVYL